MTPGSLKSGDRTSMQQGLAFFGGMTASVTHELNNVISIIDQTAGLVEDALASGGVSDPSLEEKLRRVVTSLQRQSSRGLDIIKRLNKFAHGVDYAEQEFDVNEAVRNIADLAVRLADMKRARLDTNLIPGPLPAHGSPFFLQLLIFEAVRCSLVAGEADSVIRIATLEDRRGAVTTIQGATPSDKDQRFDSARLQSVLEHVPAVMEVRTDDGMTVVTIAMARR